MAPLCCVRQLNQAGTQHFAPLAIPRAKPAVQGFHHWAFGPSFIGVKPICLRRVAFVIRPTTNPNFSHATYFYLLKEKSELSSIFESFHAETKTEFDTFIHIFHYDNAHEYFHNALSQFFDDDNIIHQSSYSRTPQQNGAAEYKIRHLSEVMRGRLFQSQAPKSY